MKSKIPFFISLFFTSLLVNAQTYVPGETYFGNNDYIEYKAGNLPIIISAPHGGGLTPAGIPDRDCSGCVYVRDSFTEELIRQMYDAIVDLFGCYPHVIINRLHRRKLDANRAIDEGADGNALAEMAWQDFHDFIEAAKDTIALNYGKGLYLDLHGHGHEIQRLELGYRITKSELQLPNSTLNQIAYVDNASIKNLVNDNLGNLSLSELIRAADSFGELYEQENYPAVPSQSEPFPFDDEPYFRGGYNTERHGSKLGGAIDGIQIECNMDGVRDSYANREDFSVSTAQVIKAFLETHYFGTDFLNPNCGFTTSVSTEREQIPIKMRLFPNPVIGDLNLEWTSSKKEPVSIIIINELGQVIYRTKHVDSQLIKIDCSNFPEGIYFIKMESSLFSTIDKFIK